MWCAPSAPTTAGPEAAELAELAGLHLLPWQRLVVEHALGQTPDGLWSAFEVVLLVARQNGKGSVLEAMELHALFVLGLNVFHTAHLMKTSRDAFKRLWSLIDATPQLRRRVFSVREKADECEIRLWNGARAVFMARGSRAGRGLTDCDVLVLDEALFLEERTTDAIVPTMSTRPNPQIWYTSSAGVTGSALLRKLRARVAAGAEGLAGFEWSVAEPARHEPKLDPTDRALWALANPSLGMEVGGQVLLTERYVANEQRVLGPEGFARERLGVFDPDPNAEERVIGETEWLARAGASARPTDRVAFAISAQHPDAGYGAIGMAGRLGEDLVVQSLDYRRGTSWVVARAVELQERHNPVGFAVDAGGPAGFLIDELEEAGVRLVKPTARDVAHASGQLLAAVVDVADLRHYGQPELDAAVASAGMRTLGKAWTWSRVGEDDISPLEAVTLAAWASAEWAPEPMFGWV